AMSLSLLPHTRPGILRPPTLLPNIYNLTSNIWPMLSFSRTLLALALFTPFTALAQQPAAPLPVFDVVAIHENKSLSGNMSIRWRGDAFVATNTNLTSLLMNAYNIREDLMSNLPAWAGSVHFDVNAKISDPDTDALKNLSREQRRAMILALLTDRFHLRTHVVTKTLPVYDLVLAKAGSKLKEDTVPVAKSTDPGKSPSGIRGSNFGASGSEMTGVAIPIAILAPNLAFQVERNVIDKTGLTGKYDFTLKWTPDNAPPATTGSGDQAPNIF